MLFVILTLHDVLLMWIRNWFFEVYSISDYALAKAIPLNVNHTEKHFFSSTTDHEELLSEAINFVVCFS
jgi:hypothetical protein